MTKKKLKKFASIRVILAKNKNEASKEMCDQYTNFDDNDEVSDIIIPLTGELRALLKRIYWKNYGKNS